MVVFEKYEKTESRRLLATAYLSSAKEKNEWFGYVCVNGDERSSEDKGDQLCLF